MRRALSAAARRAVAGMTGGLVLASLMLLPGSAAAQSAFTHVHLRVPDTAAAAAWYQQLLGGDLREGGPGPSIRFANGFVGTMPNEGTAATSRGGVIDHFAISVADIDEALLRAQRLGATVAVEPEEGNARAAIIEDPWGTRLELVEEPMPARVHHVHLIVSNADQVRDWFLAIFGGELDAEPGRDEAHRIHYGDLAVYVSEAREAATAPSRGRALDHMGFRVNAMLSAFQDMIVATGYSPYLVRPNPPGSDLMFFEGPGGIHFEIAENVAR
jgi:catechol 2,3-dioxygenase-like lactoylglutathione lyase family enzyme